MVKASFNDGTDELVSADGLALTATDNAWVTDLLGYSTDSTTVADMGVDLFAISDPSINGDFLRGQFAEAYMSLGTEPFELYSLNLYYEPTTLDHSS